MSFFLGFLLAMASGGQPPISSTPHLPCKSWENSENSTFTHYSENSPLHNINILKKLKEKTTDFVKLDADALAKARMRFQYAIYGKLFGKPPPFE